MSVEKRLIQAMNKGTTELARIAAEKYAPKGHTLQLSNGIQALNAIHENGIIIGRVVSEARSAQGFDYARKQHDEKLRHFKRPPMTSGYTEAGSAISGRLPKTRARSYRRGYIAYRDSSPKFATQYLIKAFMEVKPFLVKLLKRAVTEGLKHGR